MTDSRKKGGSRTGVERKVAKIEGWQYDVSIGTARRTIWKNLSIAALVDEHISI